MQTKKAQNHLGKLDAIILSDYILKNYGPMSHLKLQKLLFYCQAYHLGYFGVSIIDEDFQAWVHGPVCRNVYDNLKDKSILYSDITYVPGDGEYNPDKILNAIVTSLQKELLTDILNELSTWSGFELEASTHKEDPWISARRGYGNADKCEEIISKKSMLAYYAKELNG